jgi:hypothetical protein
MLTFGEEFPVTVATMCDWKACPSLNGILRRDGRADSTLVAMPAEPK